MSHSFFSPKLFLVSYTICFFPLNFYFSLSLFFLPRIPHCQFFQTPTFSEHHIFFLLCFWLKHTVLFSLFCLKLFSTWNRFCLFFLSFVHYFLNRSLNSLSDHHFFFHFLSHTLEKPSNFSIFSLTHSFALPSIQLEF